MISTNGFALLIGVDDYSTYGAESLQGSRQDVLKLYWFARELLGLPPENILVLASPPLSASDFYATSAPPPESLGPATRDAIMNGVQWLAARMAENGAAPGLLTYSGHGSYSKERGPLLCPSDIASDLEKGIAVRDLSKLAGLKAVRDRLTVVLDCCHVAATSAAAPLRVATGLPHDATPEEVAADHADFDISERVLLAARPGQHAHQALLGKVFHGALTFALVTVAEQWKASSEPSEAGMHVSYKQLLKRVRKVLWALRMRQSVRLRVPAEKRKAVRELPFFGTHSATTVRKPDAPRQKVQLTPDWFLTFSNSSGTVVAQVITVGTSSVNVLPFGSEESFPLSSSGNECWWVNPDELSSISGGASVTITGSPITSTSPPLPLNEYVQGNGDIATPYACPEEVSAGWSTAFTAPEKVAGPATVSVTLGDGTKSTAPSAYVQFNVADSVIGSVEWYLSFSDTPSSPPATFVPTGTYGASATFPTTGTTYNASSKPS